MNYQYNPYAPPQAPNPVGEPLGPPGVPQPWGVGEVVTHAWERFKQNWAVLVASYVVVTILLEVASRGTVFALGNPAYDLESAAYWTSAGVSTLVTQILTAYFQPGLIRIWVAVARGQNPTFGVLFGGYDAFLPMLGLTLLTALALGVGFALLIVPGVILSLGLTLAPYYLVDQKASPIAAMKASWKATTGQKGDVFVLMLAGVGLALLGLVMCLVGIVVTLPLFSVALAIAYTRMSGTGVAAAPGAAYPPSPYGAPPL